MLLLLVMNCLPQHVMADEDDFTPDMFPGQSSSRTEFEVSATVKVGDFGKASNIKSYVTVLNSSNQSVVKTYNENGYSAVLMTGVGTADVTYTETIFTLGGAGTINLDGPSTNHTIHYTVEKGVPTGEFIQEGNPVTEAKLIWNSDGSYSFNSPAPKITIKDLATDEFNQPYMKDMVIGVHQINFDSSNPQVATVTMRGVQPVGYGKTTITASWPGTEMWKDISISYELTVEAPKQTVAINFIQPEITGFVGEEMTAPNPILYPADQGLTIDRWTSENPAVASVNEKTGRVSFLTKGTTRIFAIIDETAAHYSAQGVYTVNVKKHDPELSFSSSEVYGELGVPFTPPTLLNPHNVVIDKWYSSNPNVAEVNEETGKVTPKIVGDAYITCETSGDATYENATASYLLHVTSVGIKVLGINVTSLNAEDVLGDGQKKVTFTPETRTLNLNGWVLDASELSTNLKDGIIVDETGGEFVINPTGDCSITNAQRCIVSDKGPVVFMSKSKTGTLTLTANGSTSALAIQAAAVKVHECKLSATGAVVAMKLQNELTVSKSAYVYAEATNDDGFAIQCKGFMIADENIKILTPGVHFAEDYSQFFNDVNNKVISKVVEIGEAPDKQTVTIQFDASGYSGIVGDEMEAPTPVITPADLGLAIDHWTSENPKVASVDETTGHVSFLTGGTTKIYAFIDEDETHFAAQGFYVLSVQKQEATLSFSASEVNAELGTPFTPPTLVNPNNVTIDKWYSSNPNVAEVNETTGEVTLKGAGSATITCEAFETETYKACTASYLVNVTSIGIRVLGIYVTSLNAEDVLGDGQKKVTFTPEKRMLNLNEWVLDATDLSTNLKDGIIVDEIGGALMINPTGDCSITNAQRCIVSDKGPVVFMSESKTGTLTLTANASTTALAIQAAAVKVHECDLSATGAVVAMKLQNELTVSTSGHVYAEATNEDGFAIQCKEFMKAGESIGILTPGVHFYEPAHQFFADENNKVLAKQVEIGKVIVTAPDDEETLIEFNVTDPDDNSAVLFSASANDAYNEETGQLEISTALTDQQVADALETLIPGSSAWVAMLPGSLVFDIPAGKGEIHVHCLTIPGYTLNIMIEGKAALSITQESFGWARISYDVAEPTHVVIYLHASSSSSPKHIAATEDRASAVTGAYISSVKIIPEKAQTAIEALTSGKTVSNGKYLHNGRLYIVRDGRVFNATGIEVK